MGKWAEVGCACANRMRVANGSREDEPYRKKHRLAASQQLEVDTWKRAKLDMFACGHRRGVVIALYPGYIISLARLLFPELRNASSNLPIFCKIGDADAWQDERLLLAPEEADAWIREIQELEFLTESASSLSQARWFRAKIGDGSEPLELTIDTLKKVPSDATALARAGVAAQ